jgi:tetratricopeptide (TPR) repeat protein
MRDIIFAIAGLLLFAVNISNAADSERCEDIFHFAKESQKLSSNESRLKYLLDNGKECEGTGLYESRLGYFYVEMQRYSDAEKVLNAGLSKPNEYHKQLKLSLIDIDVLKGHFDSAFAKAIKLQQEYSDWYASYFLLMRITLLQGRFEDAIRYAMESNKRQAPDAGMYLSMTIAYHQLGKDELAVDSFHNAAKLDPSVLSKVSGTDEVIYSLVRLTRYQEAAAIAETRIKNDLAWKEDADFLKAVNYLKKLGKLNVQ